MDDEPMSFEDEFVKKDASQFQEKRDDETYIEARETLDTNERWSRHDFLKINPDHDLISFQQIDIEHYIGSHLEGMPVGKKEPSPIMRIYGITEKGNSVMAHVHGFTPYFYVETPANFMKEKLKLFQNSLNSVLISKLPKTMVKTHKITQAVLLVEIVKKVQNCQLLSFFKITVALPDMVEICARIFEQNKKPCFGYRQGPIQTYENNVDFDIRFMVDTQIVGCNWIELPAGKYHLRTRSNQHSHCQCEVDIAWTDLISHAPVGEWAKVAPFRILSFDIECAGRKEIFPKSEHDPVIQIANCIIRQGEKEPFLRVIFTLNTCAPIIGQKVLSFKKESELLSAWADFIRKVDPDILTGYNIQDFDLTYLINRAATLYVTDFPYLGRIRKCQTVVRNRMPQSKRMDKRGKKLINIEGRSQFDLFLVMWKDYKLRSYTLNAVSFHFLGEQKEDVHHSIITDLQKGDETTRRRLAVYCCKDALLPIRLLQKLMCISSYIKTARVTGASLEYLLIGGRKIKAVSRMLRKAMRHNLIIPAIKLQVN